MEEKEELKIDRLKLRDKNQNPIEEVKLDERQPSELGNPAYVVARGRIPSIRLKVGQKKPKKTLMSRCKYHYLK